METWIIFVFFCIFDACHIIMMMMYYLSYVLVQFMEIQKTCYNLLELNMTELRNHFRYSDVT